MTVNELITQGEQIYGAGDHENARRFFEEALQIDSANALAHNNLGVLYWQAGDVVRAMDHFAAALEQQPPSRDVVMNCGGALETLGDEETARLIYQTYVDLHPEDEEVRRRLSRLRDAPGEGERAEPEAAGEEGDLPAEETAAAETHLKTPSWDNAPPGMQYAYMDPSGLWWWSDVRPAPAKDGWQTAGRKVYAAFREVRPAHVAHWRQSLTARHVPPASHGATQMLPPAVREYPAQIDAKVAITTHCNGRCKTCPVGSLEGRYGETMPFDKFTALWEMLMAAPRVARVILNNTGDMYTIEDHVRYFQHVERNRRKPVILQTNAELMDYVPMVDALMISYNGGNKEAYEFTTGMSHDLMVRNVKRHYPQLAKIRDLQLHMLMCEFNADSEADILRTWSDFPGRIRISYKYDNQMKKDRTVNVYRTKDRIFCDYLHMLSIWPDGTSISCAHDFKRQTAWGNVFELGVEGVLQHPERLQKRWEHMNGQWTGLCEKCNYNTPIGGRLKYVK